MKKSTIVIIVLAVAVIAAGVAGFFFGKNGPDAGDKPTETPVAIVSDFYRSDIYLNYAKNPERFDLSEMYGMPEDAETAFYADSASWLSFLIDVNVENTTDNDIAVYGITSEENGNDGIYICKNATAEIGIPAGASATVSVYVMCSDDTMSDEEIKSRVRNMDMLLSYSNAVTVDENGQEIPEETKFAEIEE